MRKTIAILTVLLLTSGGAYACYNAVSVRSSVHRCATVVAAPPVVQFVQPARILSVQAPTVVQSVQAPLVQKQTVEAIPAPQVIEETIQQAPITRQRTILVPQTITETVQPPPIVRRTIQAPVQQQVIQEVQAPFVQEQQAVFLQAAPVFLAAPPNVLLIQKQRQRLFQRNHYSQRTVTRSRGYGGGASVGAGFGTFGTVGGTMYIGP